MDNAALRGVRGFIFDMDGVIYRGQSVLPGAADFVANLRRAGVPLLFLTNNSTAAPAAVAERLVGMGIPAKPDNVLTSAQATAAVLAQEMPGCRVLVVGEDGLRAALVEAGCSLSEDHREADAVVVGLDRTCTYARLKEATLAVRRGAAFIGTNPDRTLPTEEGLIPGAGSLIGAIELATDRQARLIGKPAASIFLQALDVLRTAPGETAAIGDRPETDVVGAHRAGLRAIAMLTGVGTAQAFAAMKPPPDWVYENLVTLNRDYFGA